MICLAHWIVAYLTYLIPVDVFSGNITTEDERHCLTIMKYWASFVRSG